MSVRDNYTMINIREYLALGTDEEVGEPALVRLLSDFSCPKNPDVEYFLKKNAIEFTKKNQSVTYLVFSNDEGELIKIHVPFLFLEIPSCKYRAVFSA